MRQLTGVAGLLLALSLSGCGQGYQIRMACRQEAGPEPGQIGMAFGLIGALVMESRPEWQAWNDQVGECVTRKTAEAQAAPPVVPASQTPTPVPVGWDKTSASPQPGPPAGQSSECRMFGSVLVCGNE